MEFKRADIPDVVEIIPSVFEDGRGYFVETFRADLLSEFIGCEINFIQDNESKSVAGVFRGLHYQVPPFAQTKLVRVIKGSVLDIAVDIRKGSPTFGRYVAVELNEHNKKQLFIPRGFAHGFVALKDDTIFAYKVDNVYNKESDMGIAYNDPFIDIQLCKLGIKIYLSEKDKRQPFIKDSTYLFDYGVDYYE